MGVGHEEWAGRRLRLPAGAEHADRMGHGHKTVRFTSNIVGPVFILADLCCLAVSVILALASYDLIFGQRLIPTVHIFALAMTAATFLLIRSSKQAYRRTLVNVMDGEGDAVFDAIISSLIASALLWQFGLIETYSRGFNILFLLCLITCLFLSRPLVSKLLSWLAHRGSIAQRIAFYGADPVSIARIRQLLLSQRFPHLQFVGVADDRPKIDALEDLPLIGGFSELAEMARRGEVDQVLISVPNLTRERLDEVMEGLSAVSVDVSLIPQQAIELAPDYRVNLLGTIPVLTLWQRPFRDINQFIKRGEDLVIGTLALIFVAPLMGLAAILIRLTSPGPVLFVQPRVGFNNEVIPVMKFRTMNVEQTDVKGLETTSRNDPRVTPVGRILRKLSIDELPQLFNVVRGDMSLVGPRPHATHMRVGDRFYQDAVRGYAGRHRVKPGITGLAQVKGLRGEIRTVERAKRRVELDKEYIDRWSVWLDLSILLATARAVLFDNDAY